MNWKEQDLFDFELLYKSKVKDWSELGYQREEDVDRAWAATLLRQKPSLAEASRSEWFHLWLERHRKIDFQGVSPGVELYSLFFWMKVCFILLGCLAGYLLIHGSFQPHEQGESLNILAFLGVGVLLPFAFSLLSFALLWGKSSTNRICTVFALPAFLRGSFAVWMRPLWNRLSLWFSKKVNAKSRMDFAAMISEIRMANLQYGKLLGLRVASILQCFGLAYVFSLLVQIAWQFLGSLKIFIWSTSFMESITPTRLHDFVQMLSLSFSSLTEEQIASSQYTGGTTALFNSSATETWACFLIIALLLWAVLPRVILLFCYGFSVSSRVRHIDFHELYYEKLYLLLVAQPVWEQPGRFDHERIESTHSILQGVSSSPTLQGNILCFASLEYQDLISFEQCASQLSLEMKPVWDQLILVPSILHDPQQAWKNEWITYAEQHSVARVYVLQAAYEPATKQRLKFLQLVRAQLGDQVGIDVLLFGLPEEGISDAQCEDWQRGLSSLLDRNIACSNLLTSLKP